MKRLILLSFFAMFILNAFAQQGEIVSVLPNQGFQNTTMNIVIRSNNTNFRQGQTMIQFSDANGGYSYDPSKPDIKVENMTVQGPRTISASITITSRASANKSYGLRVTTGGEVVTYNEAMTVLSPGADPRVTMDVLPVQSVNIADFDPNHIKTAPILFVISIYNGVTYLNKGGYQYITARLTLTGAKYGKVGTASRKIIGPELQGSNPFRFTNRDFDKVDIKQASKDLIDNAMSTGMLPSDDYTYDLVLLGDKGQVIEGTDINGVNSITNPQSGLQLIAPGTAVGNAPDIIYNKYPQFQWFSQAAKFDIAIYKVNKANASAQDIVSQLPIYQQKGIQSTNFIYPNSAQILQEGATYAWQITGHIISSKGDKVVTSEVYWFTLNKGSGDFSNVTRIEVFPSEVDVKPGDAVQMRANLFNDREELVNTAPQWRVTPENGGTITKDGKFVAGNTPMTVAVVAKYGGVEEYSTVKIVGSQQQMGSWDFSSFIKQVFGLPNK